MVKLEHPTVKEMAAFVAVYVPGLLKVSWAYTRLENCVGRNVHKQCDGVEIQQ